MSDASEVKAAAERVMAVAGPRLESDYICVDLDRDAVAVAREYLRLMDETPIDPDWLKSVGANVAQRGAYASLTGNGMELLVTEHGFYLYDPAHGIDIPTLKTRGDVRRLCAVLGIELKEGSK